MPKPMKCPVCGIFEIKYCEKHKGYHHDVLILPKSQNNKNNKDYIKDTDAHSYFESDCEQSLIAWEEEDEAYSGIVE